MAISRSSLPIIAVPAYEPDTHPARHYTRPFARRKGEHRRPDVLLERLRTSVLRIALRVARRRRASFVRPAFLFHIVSARDPSPGALTRLSADVIGSGSAPAHAVRARAAIPGREDCARTFLTIPQMADRAQPPVARQSARAFRRERDRVEFRHRPPAPARPLGFVRPPGERVLRRSPKRRPRRGVRPPRPRPRPLRRLVRDRGDPPRGDPPRGDPPRRRATPGGSVVARVPPTQDGGADRHRRTPERRGGQVGGARASRSRTRRRNRTEEPSRRGRVRGRRRVGLERVGRRETRSTGTRRASSVILAFFASSRSASSTPSPTPSSPRASP